MTNLEKFYEKLNNYEPNSGILELKSFIERVLTKSQGTIFYKGEYWTGCSPIDLQNGIKYELLQHPTKNIFEFQQRKDYVDCIVIKRTNYEIGLYDDMYVKKETIYNKMVKVSKGYQLLLDASKTTERFTKAGFQTEKNIEEIISEHFIYISDELKAKYKLFVPKNFNHNPKECCLSDIDFKTNKKTYYLSGLNHTIQASPDETNNLVVFYKENENTICFPAYFDEFKNIYLNNFITDTRLQFYAQNSSGFENEDITFEGHTLKDAEEFYSSRIEYSKILNECNRFKTLNKKLEK